ANALPRCAARKRPVLSIKEDAARSRRNFRLPDTRARPRCEPARRRLETFEARRRSFEQGRTRATNPPPPDSSMRDGIRESPLGQPANLPPAHAPAWLGA